MAPATTRCHTGANRGHTLPPDGFHAAVDSGDAIPNTKDKIDEAGLHRGIEVKGERGQEGCDRVWKKEKMQEEETRVQGNKRMEGGQKERE